MVGEIVPQLFASMAKGSEPELMRLARSVASAMVLKLPEMTA